MRLWLQVVGLVLLTGATTRVAIACCFGDIVEWRSVRLGIALVRRVARRRSGAEVVVLRRPIEQVGADLNRLHATFHRGGMRFAKYEGCRQAYDRVLTEAAEMAGIPHLLGVLDPGSELDHERERVELLLRRHGLLPPYAA
jgi:NAD(P)-dependent dehydrogenase (short-subunit alcohol dehydrogenase family)